MRAPWNANTQYHALVLRELGPGLRRALDVGCGDGLLSAELAAAGVREVIGLDADRAVLERARARHAGARVQWVHGDLLEPPFAPASFDLVASVAALHHMDAERALRSCAELVRPGGVLVIIGLADFGWRDAPAAALALGARTALELVHGRWEHSAPQCWPPPHDFRELRELARRVLPGVLYRRHLLGRYSLVWRKS